MPASSEPKPGPAHEHGREWSQRAAASGWASTGASSGLGCFPWTTLTVLIALVSGLFTMLYSSDDGPGDQRTYVEEISQARRQLFEGQLIHTDTRSLDLVAGAEPRSFRVEVLGSWRRPGPGETQAPVSAGSQIGVKLHCSGAGVRCTPLSSERQSVLSRKDRATWMWDVSARHAGKVSIALTVTAYFRDGDTVLLEKPPMASRVEVAAPPGDGSWFSWVKDSWQWVAGAITGLGGLAVSVTAIVTAVVMVIRRRLPGADTEEAGAAERVRGPGSRPRTRSTREGRSRLGRPHTRSTVVRSLPPSRRRDAQREPHE
ncbi:hypothetical protein AB0941_41470 [Streptomyces sp. NPDC013433]|uniref:hypothetical protein n=1 Tax=Streptomyces sp. NPDC013433 TaxID=3155604 RepID=UPI0034549B7C